MCKCNCLDQAKEGLHAHLMKDVPEGSELAGCFEGTGWDNEVMSFASGDIQVMLKYRIAYRIKKKNGDIAKNLTRKDVSLKMTYCPLCGKKQEEVSHERTQA